jgi:hypothetical protein
MFSNIVSRNTITVAPVVLAFTFILLGGHSIWADPTRNISLANQHLEEVMDQYHHKFYVYKDADAGGNHFIPSGWMGDYLALGFDGAWPGIPVEGLSCTRIEYDPLRQNDEGWAAIAYQYPENNWGTQPGMYDLSGATELTFWARGERGGEEVEFKLGGINRRPYHSDRDPAGNPMPYQDSCDSLSTGLVRLTTGWQRYLIDLTTPEPLYIFKDRYGGNNHFIPCGFVNMPPAPASPTIAFADDDPDTLEGTGTSMRIEWSPSGTYTWGGLVFLSLDDKTQTWQQLQGYDLRGATTLSFRAKSVGGTAHVKFTSGLPEDTCGEVYPVGSTNGFITLGPNWAEYEFDFGGKDLSEVRGGFGIYFNGPAATILVDEVKWDLPLNKDISGLIGGFCVAFSHVNNPNGAVVYVDNAFYNLSRQNELRFLQSYQPTTPDAMDFSIRNSAHVYDNALALLAFIANQDWRRAELLADAFVFCLDHDRHFSDGRLRNAYMSGDLRDPATGFARIPGWWTNDAPGSDPYWHEDAYMVGSNAGNMAWAMIALLTLYEYTGRQNDLDATVRMGNWIVQHCFSTSRYNGYTGGVLGWEPDGNQTLQQWKSVEHNLDIYAAFRRLFTYDQSRDWDVLAEHARHFVEAMWDQNGGFFYAGTGSDGNINMTSAQIPEDAQTWAIMTLQDLNFTPGVEWALGNCFVAHCPTCGAGFSGLDFNNDRDGVWFEGTAHAALALKICGPLAGVTADSLLTEIRRAQTIATNNNGKGIVAACHDGLTTGFDLPGSSDPWYYFNRLHVGATAWYLFAESGQNPYWLISSSSPTYTPTQTPTQLTATPTATSEPTFTPSLTPTNTPPPTPSFTPQPTATATSTPTLAPAGAGLELWCTDLVLSNETMAVDMRVFNFDTAPLPITLYVAVDVLGMLLFYPSYTELPEAVASFDLPGSFDSGRFTLISKPLDAVPHRIPLTWYAALIDNRGALVGDLGIAPAVLEP